MIPGYAQEERILKYEVKGEIFRTGELAYSDSLQLNQSKKQILGELHEMGYLNLASNWENREGQPDIWQIYTGEKFEWVEISRGNVDPVFLVKSGIDLR